MVYVYLTVGYLHFYFFTRDFHNLSAEIKKSVSGRSKIRDPENLYIKDEINEKRMQHFYSDLYRPPFKCLG